ncbi:glycosyl hydrolase family 28-related protein [Burkholderia cepacia]|uniref:glycosyl hydrolase family 28-related protein n=1 Tax=Burkholderia cepacia TaxID=292 RepID=UPI002AB654B4|nr:glycosyl hydrolase family 28-related protein [Burkholderia cepacia]
MGMILPNGKTQFIDVNGRPLVGGTVTYYKPNTEIKIDTWQDIDMSIVNTNPVELDGRGQALIWGNTVYRQVVKDAKGLTIWDDVVAAPVSQADFANGEAANSMKFDGSSLAQIFQLNLNRVVDSVAKLRTLNHTVYSRAFATGYYKPYDGGGGPYQYDPDDTASLDNGGTIIVASDGGRWKLQYTSPVTVKQFGAYGDGVHDDTSAIQKALNAGLLALHFPSGNYLISTALSVSTGMRIFGDGYPESVIKPTTTIVTFNITTSAPFLLEQLGILYPTAQASGLSAVHVLPAVGQNGVSTMRDVFIARADTGVIWENSALFLMDRCFIQDYAYAAVNVSNAAYADNGDSIITSCTLFQYSDYPVSTGILYKSSGGLRVTNNKFGGPAYGIDFQYAAGSVPATAQLIVSNNSFDTVTKSAINMSRSGGTNSFNSVIITGNVFPVCGNALSVVHDPIGPWINSLVLSQNAWISPQTGTPSFASIDPVINFNIGGNTLFGNSPGSIGIAIGPQAQAGIVQGNNLSGAFATTLYIDPAAIAIRAADNQGIDPRGPMAPTVGPSPWTFSAGPFRTTLYLSSDSSIVAVTQGGGGVLPKPTGANQTFTLVLDPLEAAIITYTGTLTARGMSH